MTGNLFDNAKFGDMFLTTENKQAVFLRFAENAEYKFAILYVEDWGHVQVFRHNGKEVFNDAAHSIISKQEEPVSEDLEEAALLHLSKHYDTNIIWDEDEKCVVRDFKAGAKWYASRNYAKMPDNLLLAARRASIDMCDIDEKYLDEYPYHPIAEQKFIEGANWQKEQMMKDATECEVKVDAGGYPYIDRCIELYDYDKDIPLAKKGDKVKVIAIKED